MKNANDTLIAKNPAARRDYHLLEKFEAGLELKGSEVKSLRQGHASLREAFVRIDDKEQAWIYQLTINPYAQAGQFAPPSDRPRRLLLHKSEIRRLADKVQQQSCTIVATLLYFKGSLVKVEIALAKGKAAQDKRETIKQRDIQRDIDRELKRYK